METQKNELESQIDSVIVYQTGVQIKNIGTVNLTEGEQIINN